MAEHDDIAAARDSPASSATNTIHNDITFREIDDEEKKPFEHDAEKQVDVVQDLEPIDDSPIADDALFGDFPDGGLKAWLVSIGCSAGACATFGLVNAWGVFQAYYTQNLLEGTSPSTIAWIGSIQYALIFIPGLVIGRIFDMGYTKLPLALASVLLVVATFLTAECKEYWQFLLCQGFALGLASGTIFSVIVGLPAHWFKRRLGLALAITALGSSVGGTLFPIIVRNTMREVGFKWSIRVLGFIEIFLLAVVLATVERRLPPRHRSGPFISFSVFKSLPFTLYSLTSLIAFLGIYTVLTYIDVSAVSDGIDEDFAFYLLAIANACSTFGRLAGGLISDRIGPLNVMMPATFVAGILTYAWPFAKNTAGYIIIAVVYGASSGVYVSLLAAPVMRMGSAQDVGMRVGMCSAMIALGAVAGPPISGAINHATGNFTFTGIYAGTAVMIAVVMMMATRVAVLGRFWGKC